MRDIKEGARIQCKIPWDRVGLEKDQKGTITRTGDYWITVKWDGMESYPDGVLHSRWQFTQGHYYYID
jgi:hypothetical protein